jgi:hypothetical protein
VEVVEVAEVVAAKEVVVAAAVEEEEVFQATFPGIIFSLCHHIVQYPKLFNI